VTYDISDGNGGTASSTLTITVTPANDAPSIALIKTSTVNGTGAVGNTITYAFEVRNTGNVELTNVTVTDPLTGLVLNGSPIATLAAGATDSTTITGTYTITQSDIDNGNVTNQATVTGTPPSGSDVTDDSDDDSPTEDDPTVTPLTQNPSIALIKTGDYNATSGEIIYTFVVTNTGNVPLTNVDVDDARILIVDLPVSDLAVGESDTVIATYAITATDIADRNITNQATATGYDTNGDPVIDLSDDNSTLEDDPTVTSVTQDPSIAIVKTASVGGTGVVGDTITYTFVVTNTGNVPLTNVDVNDTRIGVTNLSVPDLAVGASKTVTADYNITASDIADGNITNQATVTGFDTNNNPVTDLSDDNSTLEDDPTVTIMDPGIAGGPNATDNLDIPINSYDPTVIDVLENGDEWGIYGPGTVEITFTQPIYGTVALDDGGTPNDPTDDVLIYTPAPDHNNITDSFEYTITDAQGNTSTATVTLNINCATSQSSDGGNALSLVSMLLLAIMTAMTGLYFIRREEERGEA